MLEIYGMLIEARRCVFIPQQCREDSREPGPKRCEAQYAKPCEPLKSSAGTALSVAVIKSAVK